LCMQHFTRIVMCSCFLDFFRYDIGLNASEAAAVRAWGGVELLPLPLSQLSDETKHPRGHLLSQPSSFAWKGVYLDPILIQIVFTA
jgi:hypothetical protein